MDENAQIETLDGNGWQLATVADAPGEAAQGIGTPRFRKTYVHEHASEALTCGSS